MLTDSIQYKNDTVTHTVNIPLTYPSLTCHGTLSAISVSPVPSPDLVVLLTH